MPSARRRGSPSVRFGPARLPLPHLSDALIHDPETLRADRPSASKGKLVRPRLTKSPLDTRRAVAASASTGMFRFVATLVAISVPHVAWARSRSRDAGGGPGFPCAAGLRGVRAWV